MSEYASKIAVGVVVAVIIGSVILAGFYFLPQNGKSTSGTTLSSGGVTTTVSTFDVGTTQTGSVITGIANHTQTSTETANYTTTNYVNTFFSTSCSISGVGGFEFRLVSDSTGAPVNADSVNMVDRLGCNNENQAVYLNNFSYLGDGWFTPVFPSQATLGGGLNITVTYEGKTFNFEGYYPPVGTDCVTLSVPSGNVNTTTVMNGCSAIAGGTVETVTESIIINPVVHFTAYICGTSTFCRRNS